MIRQFTLFIMTLCITLSFYGCSKEIRDNDELFTEAKEVYNILLGSSSKDEMPSDIEDVTIEGFFEKFKNEDISERDSEIVGLLTDANSAYIFYKTANLINRDPTEFKQRFDRKMKALDLYFK